MSRTYTIIGRVLSKKHGFLATQNQNDFIAESKKDAILQAKQDMTTCNNFEIVNVE